jgi:Ca2+-binding EF-hand superfamily protein
MAAHTGRRSSADVGVECDTEFKRFLSNFQIEKFTYMFNSFFDDSNKDGMLQKEDIDALIERLRVYRGWTKDSANFNRIHDVMYAFYDCLCEQVRQETHCSSFAKGFDTWAEATSSYDTNVDNISLNQWLNMWGRLCRGTAGMSGFPIWVQLLGTVFFEVIDRDEDGLLEFNEIMNYYKGIVGVKTEDLYVTTKEGYRALTANEGYMLNQENYLFCFANFLLGRDIYGPGKYIFGVFDNREMNEKYQIIYNEEDE